MGRSRVRKGKRKSGITEREGSQFKVTIFSVHSHKFLLSWQMFLHSTLVNSHIKLGCQPQHTSEYSWWIPSIPVYHTQALLLLPILIHALLHNHTLYCNIFSNILLEQLLWLIYTCTVYTFRPTCKNALTILRTWIERKNESGEASHLVSTDGTALSSESYINKCFIVDKCLKDPARVEVVLHVQLICNNSDVCVCK